LPDTEGFTEPYNGDDVPSSSTMVLGRSDGVELRKNGRRYPVIQVYCN
jgi:hypothetical protein